MNALWTSAEADAVTGGASTRPWKASGVSIDSRSLQPGDLFVAIKGPNTDGHNYIASAFAKGAAAALIDSARTVAIDAPLLRVPDAETGMRQLAGEARRRCHAKVTAVTGSAGKTGTKDALARVLSAQGRTESTRGNLNNHWGLPLSLCRMSRDAAFGVFELGMNSPGEISPLSQLTRPDVAIITNVESVHIAFFDSERAIADAKAEIFDGLSARGVAILNRDNQHYQRLRNRAKTRNITNILSFGRHAKADVRLIDAEIQSNHSHVRAEIAGRQLSYRLGAPGIHWVTNSLAVLAAVSALGADIDKAAGHLADVAPAPGRGARSLVRLAAGAFTLIDESYNANPASMRAALAVLGAAEGRKVAVLGDMLELGEKSREMHTELATDIVSNGVDLVFLAGPEMGNLAEVLDPSLIAGQEQSSDAVARMMRKTIRPGDTVMVKGSLGSNMAPVVAALQALGAEPAASFADACEE